MTRARSRSLPPAHPHHHPVALSSAAQQRLEKQQQLSQIQRALHSTPVDVQQLRRIAARSFLSTAFRRQIWPLLLSVPVSSASIASSSTYPVISDHPYHAQVEKDIVRSLQHFDVCRQWRAAHRATMQRKLGNIIHTVFSLHPRLHYIQGYHDIASVLLLTLDDEHAAFLLLERLSLMHIKDSLQPTLSAVISSLSLVFPLLQLVDPSLHALLTGSQVQSFFTLSWVLTWFAHNLSRFSLVQHFFDFFLSSHPSMPIYMVVALILTQRSQLSALQAEAAPEAVDASAVHALFQSLDIGSAAAVTSMCLQAEAMWQRYPTDLLCKMTETPPDSSARVRVGGMDELVRGAAEAEQEEERQRRRAAAAAAGWLHWVRSRAVWLAAGDKTAADWSWLGLTVVGVGVTAAAYRLWLMRSS